MCFTNYTLYSRNMLLFPEIISLSQEKFFDTRKLRSNAQIYLKQNNARNNYKIYKRKYNLLKVKENVFKIYELFPYNREVINYIIAAKNDHRVTLSYDVHPFNNYRTERKNIRSSSQKISKLSSSK